MTLAIVLIIVGLIVAILGYAIPLPHPGNRALSAVGVILLVIGIILLILDLTIWAVNAPPQPQPRPLVGMAQIGE